jgi:hypothetical protein
MIRRRFQVSKEAIERLCRGHIKAAMKLKESCGGRKSGGLHRVQRKVWEVVVEDMMDVSMNKIAPEKYVLQLKDTILQSKE